MYWRLIVLLLIVVSYSTQAQEADNNENLASQMLLLQEQMDIQIIGLEKISNEPKVRALGGLEQQLQQILAPYNHIIRRSKKGQIEKVVIMDKKQQTESDRVILPMRYKNGHSVVSVALSGNGVLWQTVDMVLDTGADVVVLPESMITSLGLAEYPFILRKMQTANGQVNARVGILQQINIEGERLENVEVAFIEDQLLATNNLLGMSALGRYKVVIDDKAQSITLFKK